MMQKINLKKTSDELAKATGMPNLPFDIKLPF